mmetsp:Transcript_13823/g.37500  ORF Transcript_13823/g.37500 Transcript_13823/m.37500 type:complete len:740 (+) Transcript_13823:31-2250(+)
MLTDVSPMNTSTRHGALDPKGGRIASSLTGGRAGSKTAASRQRSSSATDIRCSSKVSTSSDNSGGSVLVVKSFTAAAASRVLDAQLKELFAVYDFLGEGSLSKEVFHHVHHFASLSSREANCTSVSKLPSIQVKPSAKAVHEPRGAPAVGSACKVHTSAIWQRFASKGRINFNDFRTWQLEVQASRIGDATLKQHRLANDISELKNDLHNDPATTAWKDLLEASKSAERLQETRPLEAISALEEPLRRAAALNVPSASKHCRQRAMWMDQYRDQLVKRLREASTIQQLESALRDVEEASRTMPVEIEEVDFYHGELLRWQEPFALRVSTLAGDEAIVQVQRTDTVATVREKVAIELGVKPYRVNLACTAKELEPDTATLEELALCSCAVEEVYLRFAEVDRWQEMSIQDFLELATSLKLLSVDTANMHQKEFDNGKMSREQVQPKPLCRRIEQMEQEEEARRKSEEEARRKAEEARRQAEEKLQRAKSHLLAEVMRLSGLDLELGAASSREYEAKYLPKVAASLAAIQCLQQKAAETSEELRQVVQAAHDMKQTVTEFLAPALPALELSMKQIHMVSKLDVAEAKAMYKPPSIFVLTLQALCIMFGIRPAKCKAPNGSGLVEDYWSSGQRLLGDPRLMQNLLHYDKDNIPERIIRKLGPIVENEDFIPERVKNVSVFCSVICGWIHGVVAYHHVAVEAEPARKRLAEKEQQLENLLYDQRVIEEVLSDVMAQVNKGGTA